jgi:CRISPR-associated endonuclease/helicase Cas3
VKRHSIENWDFPFIITSSVQFFESLFANKSSACRKLHNIADSVLIFDEAQMLPVPFLIPCVRAIKTLVSQYGCSAILATATQSSLDRYFKPLQINEINKNYVEMFSVLKRTIYKVIDEPLDDESIANKLLDHNQVLCIVNSRRFAQNLFGSLQKIQSEGTYHLSTTMRPEHRKRVLDTIRERLRDGRHCRVVSTSLVEAGVDVDFSTVFRECSGLDSIIQAGGRCNREGKRDMDASFVYIFKSSDHAPPRLILHNIDAYAQAARQFSDITTPEAVTAYFNCLFYNMGEPALDTKKIVERFNDGAKSFSFPFADAAEAFKLIDDTVQRTVYVLYDAPELSDRIRSGERSRELFRLLGPYAVSLYEHEINNLKELGAIEHPDRNDPYLMLLADHYYDEHIGISLSPEGGQAILI